MQLNASRLKVLQAQDDLVQGMKEAAEKQLASVNHHHHSYRKLLKDLIVQALLRLKEPSLLSLCRESDVDHICEVLEDAKNEGLDTLASKDGRIVCENTLDARLGVIFKQKLPEIRRRLFGGIGA
ncbi:hypothetical protein GOP47_0001988 [Adiantum capillus-veneris]|uniref:V-type proton ATPase subunit E n=1 Tax=Adiantum capillus-veneris TaxID=13818 RepID=A0A9D4V9A9_ADICA|nr:hypothetical protein GOP47_0001988 [Adiantum capillus-veneris]